MTDMMEHFEDIMQRLRASQGHIEVKFREYYPELGEELDKKLTTFKFLGIKYYIWNKKIYQCGSGSIFRFGHINDFLRHINEAKQFLEKELER
jgi:hypothetical protein